MRAETISSPSTATWRTTRRIFRCFWKKWTRDSMLSSGWRQNRWSGNWLTRKLPSLLANGLISALTGTHLHDYGCTLKVYKAEIIKGVRLYGEMHRFIPAYAAWQGGRVAEVTVSHAPRMHGKSNYGTGPHSSRAAGPRRYRVLAPLHEPPHALFRRSGACSA